MVVLVVLCDVSVDAEQIVKEFNSLVYPLVDVPSLVIKVELWHLYHFPSPLRPPFRLALRRAAFSEQVKVSVEPFLQAVCTEVGVPQFRISLRIVVAVVVHPL